MSSRHARILRAALRLRQVVAALLSLWIGWAPMAAVAYGQTPLGAAQGQGEPRIRVDVSLVLLEATVKDKAGRVMGNLQHEDFVLDEDRSEEHTSELQSRSDLVCRPL